MVLAVGAIVRAAGGAEAVGGGAAEHLLPAGPLLRLLRGEAGRGDALPRWRVGLGFDVDVLAGVYGEVGALR